MAEESAAEEVQQVFFQREREKHKKGKMENEKLGTKGQGAVHATDGLGKMEILVF